MIPHYCYHFSSFFIQKFSRMTQVASTPIQIKVGCIQDLIVSTTSNGKVEIVINTDPDIILFVSYNVVFG